DHFHDDGLRGVGWVGERNVNIAIILVARKLHDARYLVNRELLTNDRCSGSPEQCAGNAFSSLIDVRHIEHVDAQSVWVRERLYRAPLNATLSAVRWRRRHRRYRR